MKKIILFISLILLALAVFLAWFIPSAYIGSTSKLSVPVNIPEGATARQVGDVLAQKGIIVSSSGYRVYSYIDAAARNPRAGDYAVVPGSSYRDLARQFSVGPARDEITVRILEGFSLRDIGAELNEWGVKTIAWNDLAGSVKQNKKFSPALREQFEFLKDLPDNATLEGYLFPDTYRVWKDQLPLGFVLKQLQEFGKQTDGYNLEAAKQGRKLHDVVILASILEKEGRTLEEKTMIAGIFLNRIKVGMRLQSDATVNYVTDAGRSRPTLDDLAADSPYNTYMHAGLPPGPICNPGKDSLGAALHPAPNDYYYYLHDADGKIYYARNIEEHKVNRYKAYGTDN
ncbi:MAG: endolytic transglycosylase MltG [Patescibacteria group bacterium]|nr:endolytic transglycosylase MltG [Patescibacteria group bacterium]